MWQSAVYPSLEVERQLIAAHWHELVDVDDEFHIYAPVEGVLIDRSLDDIVTAIRLEAAAAHSRFR